MESRKALERAKFLHGQVHQTAGRREHLPERMPLDVSPASLNYGEDLRRLKGEYNRFVQEAVAGGWLTAADLGRAGLPTALDFH